MYADIETYFSWKNKKNIYLNTHLIHISNYYLNSFGVKFQATFVFCFGFFLTKYPLEVSLYLKFNNWMSNSVDPDETAHYEPSHLDLCSLQRLLIIACGSERVNLKIFNSSALASAMRNSG